MEPTLFDPPVRMVVRIDLGYDGAWLVHISKWCLERKWLPSEIYSDMSLAEAVSAVESSLLSL